MIVHQLRLHRLLQRFVVHIGHHENILGGFLYDDRRDQALLILFQGLPQFQCRGQCSYRDPAACEILLQIFDADLTEVKKACSQNCVCAAVYDAVIEVFHLTGTARGDDRDRDCICDRTGDHIIKAALRTVAIQTGQQDLACAQGLDFLRPLDRVKAGRLCAAGDYDFIAAWELAVIFFIGTLVDALKVCIHAGNTDLSAFSLTDVDRHDHTLGSEFLAGTLDQIRIFHCGGIQGDLVCAGI